MVWVRRNSEDGTREMTSDTSSNQGYQEARSNISSVQGDSGSEYYDSQIFGDSLGDSESPSVKEGDGDDGYSVAHEQRLERSNGLSAPGSSGYGDCDTETFDEAFAGVLNEDGLPTVPLRVHLKCCFENLNAMAQILETTPSITNPVKKKLVKNMSQIKNEIEIMHKALWALNTLCENFIEDFKLFVPKNASFDDLVGLVSLADHEIRTLIGELLPPSHSPSSFLTHLTALQSYFAKHESTHPHLCTQFRELLGGANFVAEKYDAFAGLLHHGITNSLGPTCALLVARYMDSIDNSYCGYHQNTVVPWVRKVSKVGIRLWRMVYRDPVLPNDVLKTKAHMYAAHLERILDPERKQQSIMLSQLGAVVATLVPVTLAMRFFEAIVDRERGSFSSVLSVARSVEVVYARARRQLALKEFLKGRKLEVFTVVKEEKTAEKKKGSQQSSSGAGDPAKTKDEDSPVEPSQEQREGSVIGKESDAKGKGVDEKLEEVGPSKKKNKKRAKRKNGERENGKSRNSCATSI